MTGYIVRRLLQSAVTSFPMTIVFYVIVRGLPLPPGKLQKTFLVLQRLPLNIPRKMADKVWNLTIPWPHQYLLWLQQTLSGTFGQSFYVHRPAAALLSGALGASAALVGTAILLTLLIGVPLGVYQATHRNGILDHLMTGITYVLLAIPPYVLGLFTLWVLAVDLRWFPPGGMRTLLAPYSLLDVLHHMVLPALCIALGNVAIYSRYMRTSVLDQLSQDYIRTAHAKGMRERRISWRHIVPNALIPVVMNLGTNLAQIISTTFIIEFVFGWQGLGILFVQAVYSEDYNLLMAILVTLGLIVMAFNLITDVISAMIDHRIVYA